MTREGAEDIAARALLFLVEDEGRLVRFLGATGLDPQALRGRARSPEVLAAALGHVMEDESTLLAFAANANIPPESLASVSATLGIAGPWDSA